MKKGTYKKPESKTSQAVRKSKIQKKSAGIKSSQSEGSLIDCFNSNAPKRKASTPTNEHNAGSFSPDISCILDNETKPHILKKKEDEEKIIRLKTENKTATAKDTDLQDILDFEYTRYLQTVFKNKIVKSNASEIEENIAKLQKRITENEQILQKTTQRLKNINFNKEIELLHSLHNPNYGNICEVLDKSNCNEYLASLHDKLEQGHNQLKVNNVELLEEGGGAQLVEVIKETIEAFEKLKLEHDVETPKLIAQIQADNRSTVNALSRCKDNLPKAENLLLTKAALEISSCKKQ